LEPEYKIFEPVIVFLIGLVLGSFATALSWRATRDISWVHGRSRCPSCQTALGFPDLIPLFSWLFLKGRCRHCGKPVSIRYPLTELAVLAGCFGVFAAWGFTVPAFITMAALPFLAALFIIDIQQMILPDGLQVILAALGLLFTGWLVFNPTAAGMSHVLVLHLGGAVLFAAIIWIAGKIISVLKKKDALGFGDVKFFAIAGLWLGAGGLSFFMVLAGLMGIACGLAWRLRREDRRFPFGPALILAFYACLLLQGLGQGDIFAL
jgi:leader peptidase (prepilin peptidase) / N-methyltransferase